MARGQRNTTFTLGEPGDAKPADGGPGVEPVIDPREIDAAAPSAGNDGDLTGSDGGEIRYNKDGSVARKRGRKAGYKQEGSAKKTAPLDVNAIQYSLTGMHALLAMAMYPRDDKMQAALSLTPEESATLANNAAAVARHYDIVASQKSIDWFNLIMSVATIEGPRLFLMARNAKPKPAPLPSAPHFMGKRDPATPQASQDKTSPVVTNGLATHKPTEQEKNALLNEPVILQPMHG